MLRKWLFSNLMIALVLLGAQAGGVRMYSTPEQARDALVQAAANGLDSLRSTLGPESADILRTGDAVQDQTVLDRFNRQAKEKTRLDPDPMNPNRIVLLVGQEEWPFAVPLKRRNGQWHWDLQEGRDEIRYRTIGGNELDAIEICHGYVEAQEAYAEKDWNGDGVRQYARRIVSSPGKKDGLFWPGEDSPVAQRFAKAAAEGYSYSLSNGAAAPKPYHGYFYRVLTKQGPAAEDGARDYMVRDLMIGGFALVAWPAGYGVSGIKTFIVNQDGVVYEKDLGPRTNSIAKEMTTFNPDPTWQVSPWEDSPAEADVSP